MANYANLIQQINAAIRTNGANQITGQMLQTILDNMVASLGANYQYAGVATPATNPGTPDQNVFYLAATAGTYTNFGGIVLTDGEVAALKYNGSWAKDTTGAASLEKVNQLGQELSVKMMPLFQISNSIANFVINGEYYDGDGNIDYAATYSRLPKLDVAGSTKIYYSDNMRFMGCRCYNANNEFIGSATNNIEKRTQTLVEGTKYVGISWNNTSFANYDNTYFVFSVVIDKIYTRLTSLEDFDASVPISVLNVLFKNVFFLDDYFIDNYYYDGGTLTPDGTHRYASTQKLPVSCSYVRINGFIRNSCKCWNGDTYLGEISWTNPTEKKFALIEGTNYIAFSFVKEEQPAGYRDNGIIYNFEPYVPQELVDTLNKYAVKKTRTYNLYDKDTMFVDNSILDNAGAIQPAPGWGRSDYIPVEANTEYYFYASYWGRTTNFAWFDSSKTLLQVDSSSPIKGFHTSPANAAYFICTLKSSSLGQTTDFMMAKSSTELPYMPYYKLDRTEVVTENIADGAVTNDKIADGAVTNDKIADGELSESKLDTQLQEKINRNISGAIKVLRRSESGTNGIYIYDNNDYIKALYPDNSYNKTFNFSKINKNNVDYYIDDDIPATHILNTTLAGNHAQPITKATITSHGFTNTDIGTAWVYSGNNKTYYIVKIFDANNIGLLSANEGTYSSPRFVNFEGTGTITNGDTTKTITAAAASQMWPGEQNVSIKFLVDGKEIDLLTEDYNTEFYGEVIDIVESYDVANPVSVLNNLIANAGSSSVPSYEGTPCLRVEHTFRFQKNLNVLFLTSYIALEEIAFDDYLFGMKKPLGTLANLKYYIPNSKPLSTDGGSTYTFDCRTPSDFPMNTVSTIYVDSTRKENVSVPINRVLQFNTANNCGIAIGIFSENGVGKKLDNYTDTYFELRRNAGSIYPLPVKSTKVGNTLSVGDIYTGVMYWGFFDSNLTSADNRMSMYHFQLNGAEYVYIDYKGSKLDKVVLDDSFNGKTVEVIESSNAALVNMNGDNSADDVMNNIYNGGFYVDADYVSGETCYIICKIK